MKRGKRPLSLYVTQKRELTANDLREILKPSREALASNVAQILGVCEKTPEPHTEQAQRLASDVRDFQQCLLRADENAAWLARSAMQIGSAFERLRANILFAKPALAGLGTMKGGRRNAGDHSGLIAWGHKRVAEGLPPRGLAAQAVRDRVTKLSARQALDVLRRAGVIPARLKRK